MKTTASAKNSLALINRCGRARYHVITRTAIGDPKIRHQKG